MAGLNGFFFYEPDTCGSSQHSEVGITMKLYHRTPAADSIINEGFRDSEGTYMTAHKFKGVWLSDRPLDSNEGTKGTTLLRIEIPEETIAEFEWIEEGKPYREFLVPAQIVND